MEKGKLSRIFKGAAIGAAAGGTASILPVLTFVPGVIIGAAVGGYVAYKNDK